MNHIQKEPPAAPNIRSLRRPRRSISQRSQTTVRTVLTTPKIPVVRKPVEVPVIPMDLKTVGEYYGQLLVPAIQWCG
jgi:hypothetical protein